jgi:hypothetical protein
MTSEDNLFRTLTSDDWKRGLAVARATPNDVSIQLKNVCLKLSIAGNKPSMLSKQVKRDDNGS